MDERAFDCSTWSFIKLAENKTLLCGVVYRSPNSNDENTEIVEVNARCGGC
jgi:hypothetical protein